MFKPTARAATPSRFHTVSHEVGMNTLRCESRRLDTLRYTLEALLDYFTSMFTNSTNGGTSPGSENTWVKFRIALPACLT